MHFYIKKLLRYIWRLVLNLYTSFCNPSPKLKKFFRGERRLVKEMGDGMAFSEKSINCVALLANYG